MNKNIKGTWNIGNKIIRNRTTNTSYTDHFIDKGMTITNMNEVVEGFNNSSVSVGPKLAKESHPPQARC